MAFQTEMIEFNDLFTRNSGIIPHVPKSEQWYKIDCKVKTIVLGEQTLQSDRRGSHSQKAYGHDMHTACTAVCSL
jgi:hypothetical protein